MHAGEQGGLADLLGDGDRMIDFALRTLGPTKFKQLYLAQGVGELGQLFRNVRGNLNGKAIYQH